MRTHPSFATGSFDELFDQATEHDRGQKDTIAGYLSGEGKQINPPYRIPAADINHEEVFFDDLEMLSRFANMPLPNQ